LAIVMFVFLQTSQWPKAVNQRKTNITMAKSRNPKKGKHHNGQKKRDKQRSKRHCTES
jgi:hypothetical protein